MLINGVVLVKTKIGLAYRVSNTLRNKRHTITKKTFVALGPYDVVVVIVGNSIAEIGKFVVDEIQTLEGVVSTLTMISADDLDHQPLE